MPIKQYKCPKCGSQKRTKKGAPECCNATMEEQILAPQTLFFEKTDPEKGVSKLVNQDKILRERARNHSRDTALEELIETNELEIAVQNKWIREDGQPRKKIDDI